MLLALFSLLGLTMALRTCIEAPEKISIPPCSNKCLSSDTSILDGVCADNIKGICELDGGVASFFRVYSVCLKTDCSTASSRESLVRVFQEQCGWSSSITDAQAQYFGSWQVYLQRPVISTQVSTTITQQKTSFATAPPAVSTAESTFTYVGGPNVASSEASSSQASSSQASSLQASSSGALSSKASSSEASVATLIPTTDSAVVQTATLLDNVSSPASQTSSSVYPSSSTPSAPAAQKSKPASSTSTIAGIAVGSVAVLGFVAFAAFLLLRCLKRRRQAQYPVHPPLSSYEPGKGAGPQEKPWSNVEDPRLDPSVPVGCVELDGGSPVSPVWEPVEVSARERRQKIAKNF